MRRMILTLLFITAGLLPASAQWSGYDYSGSGSEMDAGAGMTWIDGKAFYMIGFQPDIRIGKFGIGLGVSLLYNVETGEIRSEDWDSDSDYLRIIRYVRYGFKGDPFYVRAGALDRARLGHGFILNFYNNQLNYDQRKIGLSLDADFGYAGIETMTNNLNRLEVVGARVYGRPFFGSPVPVIRRFAVGVSAVTDLDPDAWRETEEDVTVWGMDVELPLIRSDLLSVLAYADLAKIRGYGSGTAMGVRTDVHVIAGILDMEASFERRFLGKEFVPAFYGPFYEMLRYTGGLQLASYYETLGGDRNALPEPLQEQLGTTDMSKKTLLPMMDQERRGWYGALTAHVLHLIQVTGSYEYVDSHENSGRLHLSAGLSRSIPFLALDASYDKWGIRTFRDMRTLDYRSLARLGVGYKVKPYLLLYMDYIWSFEYDSETGRYTPQERVQPRLAFRFPL